MNEARIFTQRLKLLDHLKRGLPITQRKAEIGYAIARPKKKMKNSRPPLRQVVHRIVADMEKVGKTARVGAYRLGGDAA